MEENFQAPENPSAEAPHLSKTSIFFRPEEFYANTTAKWTGWNLLEQHSEAPMRQRGRKSAAAMSVVQIAEDQRPQPPARLSGVEKRVWLDTVGRLPPHWFRGSEPVLECYCVAVNMARFLSKQVKAAAPGDERFSGLVKLQRAEAALVARLAGTLRLTPRSTWSRTPQLISARKPWEVGSDWRREEPEQIGRGFEQEMQEVLAKARPKPDPETPPAA
jgi:hypothetical protein